MAKARKPARLCDPDPWSVVDEARAQRGLVVAKTAKWLIAAIAFMGTARFWMRVANHSPASPQPEPFRAELSSTPDP